MRFLSLLGTTLAYREGKRLGVTGATAPPDPPVPGSPRGDASPSPQHSSELRWPELPRPSLLLARGVWLQAHADPSRPEALHTSSVWPSGSSM